MCVLFLYDREGSLEVLKDLLTRNLRQNLNIVVQIASKYSDPLGPENLMKVQHDTPAPSVKYFFLNRSAFNH